MPHCEWHSTPKSGERERSSARRAWEREAVAGRPLTPLTRAARRLLPVTALLYADSRCIAASH